MDKLNQWLTLLANLSILAGIGFLAFEIRQNTDAIHSQTRAVIYQGAQEELWKNMEYPDVTLNFVSSDHQLSSEEKIRLDAWLTASLQARQFAWLEYNDGNMDIGQWESEQQIILIIVGTERTRKWWKDIGNKTFHADFVNHVNELIANNPENDFAEKVLSIE